MDSYYIFFLSIFLSHSGLKTPLHSSRNSHMTNTFTPASRYLPYKLTQTSSLIKEKFIAHDVLENDLHRGGDLHLVVQYKSKK